MSIEQFTVLTIYFLAKALGFMAIIAGLLWLLEKLATYIIKSLGVWNALIEFFWERARKKHDLKQIDK